MPQNIEKLQLEEFLNSGAIFSENGKVWLFWGDVQKTQSRPDGPAICAPDFFLPSQLEWYQFSSSFECHVDEFQFYLNRLDLETSSFDWQQPEMENFKTQFDWVEGWRKQENIQKVVPYVFETAPKESKVNKNLLAWIQSSLDWDRGFLYGIWDEDGGLLGRSPETLIEQRTQQDFLTMALAGTTSLQSFEKSPESFLFDEKEIHEHQIVVEDIKKQLIGFGEVLCGERDVILTPSLAHFKTPIQLKADGQVSLFDLIRSLHPTPALGVFPREKSKVILDQLDTLNTRNRFGAPFAISFNPLRAHVIVAIRNVSWTAEEVRIGSGCGVVEESIFEKEWIELKDKRDSVKKIFGLL